MFRFRELLDSRKDELAEIITREHGKVHSDALGEISRGLEVVEFACGVPHLLKGGYSESVSTGVDVHSIRQPLGVVGVISPFNFPAMVPMWFFPLAIARGNTVVLKPSEKDPSASLWIARLWAEAGLPDGVFNVLQGDKVAVDALLHSPDVAAISFVGSTPVAEYVYETGTPPASASRPSAAPRTTCWSCPTPTSTRSPTRPSRPATAPPVSAAWPSASSSPSTPSGDDLVARIADRTGGLRVGDGASASDGVAARPTWARWSPASTPTGCSTSSARARSPARRSSSTVAPPEVSGEEAGYWVGPTLFDHVTPDMTIYTEEIFGPVLSVVRVGSYREGLDLINANPYGNGTAIFTGDGAAARMFENEVEVGMVGINVPIPVPMAYYSFGGWKRSLFGDSHAHGTEGVHFFTRGKVVTSRWGDPAARRSQGVDLGFPPHD